MKNKIAPVFAAIALLLLSGCTISGLNKKLNEFEKLGLTEVEITGKFSHTEYRVEDTENSRRAVLDHTNYWVPKVRIVREKKK